MRSMFAVKCFTCLCIFFITSLFYGLAVAVTAQGFILHLFAKKYLFIHIHQTMAYICQSATSHTNCVHLAHLIGYGQQTWHWPKRFTPEVQVQTRHYDPDSLICQLVAYLHDVIIKKLRLIYTYHIIPLRHKQNAGTGIYRSTGDTVALVTYYILIAVSCIHGRFKYLNLLPCEHGTLHTSYQFLCLAREH